MSRGQSCASSRDRFLKHACFPALALVVYISASAAAATLPAQPPSSLSRDTGRAVKPHGADPGMLSSPAEVLFRPVIGGDRNAWKLTWHDEFDGSSVDPTKWSVFDWSIHGDTELELYLKDSVAVENGTLVITTSHSPTCCHRESYSKCVQAGCDTKGTTLYNYTSGWLQTQGHFSQKYGLFEVRAKLPDPSSYAIWPAHWLMPDASVCWPTGGEIDIMESVGGLFNNSVFGTYHWATQCNKDLRSGPNGKYPDVSRGAQPIDFSKDFHVFSVTWNATSIQWYVDGQQYWERHDHDRPGSSAANVTHYPMYMILNTAIADWAGMHSASKSLKMPVQHFVDYVRVYALDGDSE